MVCVGPSKHFNPSNFTSWQVIRKQTCTKEMCPVPALRMLWHIISWDFLLDVLTLNFYVYAGGLQSHLAEKSLILGFQSFSVFFAGCMLLTFDVLDQLPKKISSYNDGSCDISFWYCSTINVYTKTLSN